MTKNTKIKSYPTITPFDGLDAAEDILENILHRKYWAAETRDLIAEKLESLVSDEVARKETHRAAVEKAKEINAKIAALREELENG
jgi:hypothetical protein